MRKNEVFEVHITGDKRIFAEAAQLGIKTISICLLRPDRSYLRSEFMTSQIFRFENYDACKVHVDKLVSALKQAGVKILRVKIESPYYEHYREQSLYMESHFEATDNQFPISKNARKDTYLATDRVYEHGGYDAFREKHKDSKELELCLYDSDVNEDADWFDLYLQAV